MIKNQQTHTTSHFLATITGCMLLLAGAAGAHTVAAPVDNIRHTDVLTHSLDGKLQNTIRKIRHLASFFLDQDNSSRPDQNTAIHSVPANGAVRSDYTSVFSHKVRHVKNQEIRSWLLRV